MKVQVQLREGDMSYADFLSKADAQEQVEPHVADAYDTCNILFSSGTTGKNDSAVQSLWLSFSQDIIVGCKLSDCHWQTQLQYCLE